MVAGIAELTDVHFIVIASNIIVVADIHYLCFTGPLLVGLTNILGCQDLIFTTFHKVEEEFLFQRRIPRNLWQKETYHGTPVILNTMNPYHRKNLVTFINV